jgi:ABC-type branched-subunit amino acid transport system substrate-binding protein
MVPAIKNIDDEPVLTRLTFNDYDKILTSDNTSEEINAPKTIERLEEISSERALQRKLEEEDDDDDGYTGKINIDTNGDVDLGMLDIFDLNSSQTSTKIDDSDILLNDVEELY